MKKNNKIAFLIMMLGLTSFLVGSCKKDNGEYPKSRISGAFLYNGQPVGLLGSNNGAVQLQQTGGPSGNYTVGVFTMYAQADGTYSMLTYDGDYTVNATQNKGPFVQPAPINLTLKGEAKDVNFNVTPYFWVSNYQSSYVGGIFKATFKLEKTAPSTVSVNLVNVALMFGPTNIVDETSKGLEKLFTTTSGVNVINIGGNCSVQVDLNTLTATEKAAMEGRTGHVYANLAIRNSISTNALYQKPVMLY
ncbi:hypothetical protein GCM10027049_01890 [Mucilaginibacter puniceus]